MDYYYKLTDKPALGMIYWENGRYLHPQLCITIPGAVKTAQNQYILRIDSSHTIIADTDGGCDRTCECVDYQPLQAQNIIMDGDKPIGVYLDLGYYYSVSYVRPNVIVLSFEDGACCEHPNSGNTYTLIPYDPQKSYESFSYIR